MSITFQTQNIQAMTKLNQSQIFIYACENIEISALIDTGSSLNVMSQQSYNSIPATHKFNFKSAFETITLANNQCVIIFGTSDIKITVSQGKHWIPVYIMSQTSHPLILGTNMYVLRI